MSVEVSQRDRERLEQIDPELSAEDREAVLDIAAECMAIMMRTSEFERGSRAVALLWAALPRAYRERLRSYEAFYD